MWCLKVEIQNSPYGRTINVHIFPTVQNLCTIYCMWWLSTENSNKKNTCSYISSYTKIHYADEWCLVPGQIPHKLLHKNNSKGSVILTIRPKLDTLVKLNDWLCFDTTSNIDSHLKEAVAAKPKCGTVWS